jgi:predicted ATPase
MGRPRFAMLAPVREYALERLASDGEADLVWRAHAKHFATFAEEELLHVPYRGR